MEEKPLKISAVLIVKNEKDHIARVLESVKEADEIIVCDTGSEDNTVEISKRYTDNVYTDYKWEKSFCKARNYAKSKATGAWILSIDADEFLGDKIGEPHFEKVREAVAEAERIGAIGVNVTQINESDGQINYFPRLFKNLPTTNWEGAAHNYLNINAADIGDVKLTYGFSSAHLLDPDRTLNILETEYKEGRAGARELYYLGREYKNKGRFSEATAVLGKYVQISRFPAEKAEAFLNMAHCYWEQRMIEDARDACLQALKVNPNFREAIYFMAQVSEPHQARRWQSFAPLADNSNVLFIRTK